jgi:hypothetical protein
MNQLLLYAPLKGPEGYSRLSRDLIMELDKAGVHVCLEEFKHWGPFEVGLTVEQHQVLGRCLTNQPFPQKDPITSLNVCLPEQVKLRDGYRNSIYTMFEADRICPEWVDHLKAVDNIYVPTSFNHWSFTTSGVRHEKVKVLPIGFDEALYNESVEPLRLDRLDYLYSFPIRFISVNEITNRKNFWGTMQAFYQVASALGSDHVCMILKVGSYSTILPIRQQIQQFQKSLVKEGLIKDVNYHVFLYPPLIPEVVHPQFLALGTHYMTFSLGEGWDLTALQCAALGLPIFVPFHTAYQCWLNTEVCTMFPVVAKAPARQPGLQRLYEGSNWILPNLSESVELLICNLIDPTLINLKADHMRDYIKKYRWSSIIPQYLETL